jgi:hypothetical protein
MCLLAMRHQVALMEATGNRLRYVNAIMGIENNMTAKQRAMLIVKEVFDTTKSQSGKFRGFGFRTPGNCRTREATCFVVNDYTLHYK